MTTIERAVFGNRAGSHHLLESSLSASASVLDTLRFLVDRPAGHVGSEVRWFPYWGCQPIEGWWTIWRGEEDPAAPRKNMVVARVALIPIGACSSTNSLDTLLAAVGGEVSEPTAADLAMAGEVIDRLACGEGPAVIPDVMSAPDILRAIWPRLWVAARASLSLRTLFGTESLDSVSTSSIVVVPSELKPRWNAHRLIETSNGSGGPAARWFAGEGSPRLAHVVGENVDRLPGDFAVLQRLARVAERLDKLEAGKGTAGDALVVIRTQEAFAGGLALPSDDVAALHQALTRLDLAPVDEVRAASLARMDLFPDTKAIEAALAKWVAKNLTGQLPTDALWIIEQAAGERHEPWWRRAISNGVLEACKQRASGWADALWCWWQERPDSVTLLARYVENSAAAEKWLAASAPRSVQTALLDALTIICRNREWPLLLSSALGVARPLVDCVERIRAALSRPEAALDSLLTNRSPSEVIDAASDVAWPPLLDYAVQLTLANPALLVRAAGASDPVPLVARHVAAGGAFPADLLRQDFLYRVVDGALGESSRDCVVILKGLEHRAGGIVIDHPKADEAFRINEELAKGAVEEWWRRFLKSEDTGRPPSGLVSAALQLVRTQTRDKPVALVISLLRLFPEIAERDFEEWMKHTGHLWEVGDHARMADVLVERRWNSAAKAFRWSWKRELKLVAWHARELLSWFDRFWSAPEGASDLPKGEQGSMSSAQVKVLFLAANPGSSTRLALDEEARAIEEKVRDSKHRDLVIVRTRWAVRPGDLQQAFLEDEPTVVHFSGHGGGDVGIVLAGGDPSEESLVGADALADLFRVLKDGIRVVVLNACFSEVQAKTIVEQIDFVVGMGDSIGDEAARVFSAAFYRGLAFGRTVRSAFELGINELKLAGLGAEDSTPQLLVRQGADADAALVGQAV